jgi:hypothetical protein
MAELKTEKFKQSAAEALKDGALQRVLNGFQKRVGPATAASYQALPKVPDSASRLKQHAWPV